MTLQVDYMNDKQQDLNDAVRRLLENAAQHYSTETGASKSEAKMTAMLAMLKDLQVAMGATLPQLDQAIAVLEQGRLDAQIRDANKNQQS